MMLVLMGSRLALSLMVSLLPYSSEWPLAWPYPQHSNLKSHQNRMPLDQMEFHSEVVGPALMALSPLWVTYCHRLA